jgi:glycyl-tRNA synthetase beta chain
VVFQEKLGSVYDKAERVSKLAAFIAPRIGGNAAWATRAGLLSKCDLATEMVGEFPEMQVSPATTTPSTTASRKTSPWR